MSDEAKCTHSDYLRRIAEKRIAVSGHGITVNNSRLIKIADLFDELLVMLERCQEVLCRPDAFDLDQELVELLKEVKED